MNTQAPWLLLLYYGVGRLRIGRGMANRKVRKPSKAGSQQATRNQRLHVFRVSLQSFRVHPVWNQECSEFGNGDSRKGLPARSLASTMVEDSVR
jgi:hypothetical protein